MHHDFAQLMQTATRLTQEGKLTGATAAIQRALGARQPPAEQEFEGDVIDVEARVIAVEDAAGTDAGQPANDEAGAGTSAFPAADAEIPPVAADAESVPRTEAFLAGRYGTGAAGRDYKLFVPPGTGSTPLPLVVMLHGCTQDPDDFAAGTAMNEAAREQGFFVLYPAQSQSANPQRCWNWFKHSHQVRGRGEPATLAGMTKDVMSRYAIDPSRVYVAGLSAGGAMAAILGDTYPDVFAAVGVHSGLAAGAASDLPSALGAMQGGGSAPARTSGSASVPTIVFHGDADRTVHPRNGEHAFAAPLGGGASATETESGSSSGGRRWTRSLQRDAGGKIVAEHWEVHGAGHAWSGGDRSGSYTDPAGPDATAAMLAFFALHRTQR